MPVATDDNFVVSEDDPSAPIDMDVKVNDTGDLLKIVHVNQPLGGLVTITGLDHLAFTPDPNWDQDLSFDYTVCDGDELTKCDIGTVHVDITALNDAPVAADDLGSTAEGVSTVITVLNNDTDVDTGDTATLSVISVTSPANGTAALLPNGTIQYTPAPGFVGVDTFSYTVSDVHAATSSATVTVYVSAEGEAPTAVMDVVSTPEDTLIQVDVLANDFDSYNNGPLTINAVESAAHGNVTANLNVVGGKIQYIPDPQFNGHDTFTYTVCNVIGACSTAELEVTVESVNDLPVARDDFTILTEDDEHVVIDALANDSDEDANDGDAPNPAQTIYIHRVGPAAATIAPPHPALAGPTSGTVVITGTGSASKLDYTPNADFNGTDSFEYEICDTFDDPGQSGQGGCAVAKVFINVKLVNDPPIAVDDSASMAEDGVPIDIDVLANDTDTDDLTLLIASVSQPTNGSVYINAGQVNYTPDANYHGTDTFNYTVCDSWNACDVGLVTVTVANVNDAPLAQDDIASTPELESPDYLTANPTGFLVIDVLANDSEVEGQALHFPVPGITVAPTNGSAWISGGKVNYIPDSGFIGVDTLTYQVCDPIGGVTGCSTANVKIFVLKRNLAPFALDDVTGTNEDTLVSIPVLLNDYDPDGDPLHINSITQPANGQVVVNGTNIEFTPDLDWNGQTSFTYNAADPMGAVSNVATVTVTVKAVADNPYANDDIVITPEDSNINVDVLANDDDPDNAATPLRICAITIQPAHGVAVMVGSPASSIQVQFAHGYSGHDSLEYQIGDGSCNAATTRFDTATVLFFVTPVNAAPDAIDDNATTPAGEPVDINVKANDKDADGDTLTVNNIVTDGAHGHATINADNTVHYVPDFNFEGQDSFVYSVCDPDDACDTATVYVSVGHDDAGSISGSVYFDSNGNGSQDLGEADLQGVKVQLFKWNNGTNMWDLVSAGTIQSPYLFSDLPSGEYRLVIDPTTVPQGLVYTEDPSGLLDGQADVSMQGGSSYSGQDFGLWLGADLPETH